MEIGNINSKGINDTLLTRYLIGADQMSDTECINCNLLPICNGGCPYVRIQNEFNENRNQETCEIFKNFEKEFLLTHISKKEKQNEAESNR